MRLTRKLFNLKIRSETGQTMHFIDGGEMMRYKIITSKIGKKIIPWTGATMDDMGLLETRKVAITSGKQYFPITMTKLSNVEYDVDGKIFVEGECEEKFKNDGLELFGLISFAMMISVFMVIASSALMIAITNIIFFS